jgi:hypothetical protein
MRIMNKLLEALLDRAEDWPEEAQAEAVRSLLDIERRKVPLYRLGPEERAAIEEASAQIERGEFASEVEIKALLDRFRA